MIRAAAALLLVLAVRTSAQAQADPWRPVGPWGGAAEIVRTSSADPGVVLAATRTGTIVVSRTGGDDWHDVPFPAREAGVLRAMEMDPRSPGVWYAGIDGEDARTRGVYRTRDAGRQWTLLPGTQGLAIWSLAVSPTTAGVVAAGTDSGIFRSDDGGDRWVRISPAGHRELRPVVALALAGHDDRTLLAGTTRLPWRTTDGGATWQAVTAGMVDDSDVFSIVVDPATPGRVLASACTGVYVSGDGGSTWTRLPTPHQAFRVHVVAVDPRRPGTIFAGTTAGLLRSTDRGATWRAVSRYAVRAVAFDVLRPQRIYFASTDGGILRSTDGGATVAEASTGFANRSFASLEASGSALRLRGPVSLRSDDLATRWVEESRRAPAAASAIPAECAPPPAGGSVYGVAVDSGNPSTVLAATARGVFRSTDRCATWAAVTGGLEPATAAAVLAHPVRQGEAFVAQGGRVYRSEDGGRRWQPVGRDRADFWPSALVIVPSAPDRLFALVPNRGVFSLVLGENAGGDP